MASARPQIRWLSQGSRRAGRLHGASSYIASCHLSRGRRSTSDLAHRDVIDVLLWRPSGEYCGFSKRRESSSRRRHPRSGGGGRRSRAHSSSRQVVQLRRPRLRAPGSARLLPMQPDRRTARSRPCLSGRPSARSLHAQRSRSVLESAGKRPRLLELALVRERRAMVVDRPCVSAAPVRWSHSIGEYTCPVQYLVRWQSP